MRVDEERERDRENGHELFMNASMKGGKAVGVGWRGSDTARLSPGDAITEIHPSPPPLSKFVLTASFLIPPLAGKTINYCKGSDAKC